MNNFKTKWFCTTAVFIIVLFFSCNQSNYKITEEKVKFPVEGQFCFTTKDNNNSLEFIQMKFMNKRVEGIVFLEEGVNGKVFYEFKGTIINDSIVSVHLHYIPEDIVQKWIIYFTNNGLIIKNSFGRDIINYSKINCDDLPNKTEYFSVEEIAEYTENNSRFIYYESTSPNAYKRNTLTEYIKLWLDGNKINGKGSGYSEGDPEWIFELEGNMINDSLAELTVNYSIGKTIKFSTFEKWIINKEGKQIHLDGLVKDRPGANYYHQVEAEDIPDFFLKNIK